MVAPPAWLAFPTNTEGYWEFPTRNSWFMLHSIKIKMAKGEVNSMPSHNVTLRHGISGRFTCLNIFNTLTATLFPEGALVPKMLDSPYKLAWSVVDQLLVVERTVPRSNHVSTSPAILEHTCSCFFWNNSSKLVQVIRLINNLVICSLESNWIIVGWQALIICHN